MDIHPQTDWPVLAGKLHRGNSQSHGLAGGFYPVEAAIVARPAIPARDFDHERGKDFPKRGDNGR